VLTAPSQVVERRWTDEPRPPAGAIARSQLDDRSQRTPVRWFL